MSEGLRFDFEAIGTRWVIDVFSEKKINTLALSGKIKKKIRDFSSIFSRFENNSSISEAAKHGGKIHIPDSYAKIVELYKRLYDLTDGAFTPLVGNLLVDAGYNKDYSLNPGKLNLVLKWDEVIKFSPSTLEVKRPWILDFGAGGKGFLVDLIGELLKKQGIKSYCIDAGGDILYQTEKNEPMKIGLEHPDNFKQVLGTVEIINKSICGSSGNRRKWGQYHHIFNPKTLDSVKDVLAVWVVSDTALLADAVSTSLFLIEPEKLNKEFTFEYLIIYPDYTFKKSKDFPGEIYIA